jgi:tetratricopeptide (TPR) repeat protein
MRQGEALLIGLARCTYGISAFFLGDWDRAMVEVQRAMAAIEGQDEHSLLVPYAIGALGQVLLAVGEVEAGVHHMEKSVRLAQRTGDLLLLRLMQPILAEWELLAGRADAARDRLLPLLDRESLRETFVVPMLPIIAWAELARGDVESAAARLDEALTRTRDEQLRLPLTDALRVAALYHIQRGEWADAERALDEALSLVRAMPYPYGEVKLLDTAGMLDAARGAPERARERYEQALALCARLGEQFYAVRIEHALANLKRT